MNCLSCYEGDFFTLCFLAFVHMYVALVFDECYICAMFTKCLRNSMTNSIGCCRVRKNETMTPIYKEQRYVT